MHTFVYSFADNVRLFFRGGRALGVYGSMLIEGTIEHANRTNVAVRPVQAQ